MDANGVSNELSFSQTQSPRVKDPGIPVTGNPPPPPPQQQPTPAAAEPSPHPFRGHNVNTLA